MSNICIVRYSAYFVLFHDIEEMVCSTTASPMTRTIYIVALQHDS